MQTKLSKVETRKADLANLAQNNLVFTYDNPRKMNHLPKKSKKIIKKIIFLLFWYFEAQSCAVIEALMTNTAY